GLWTRTGVVRRPGEQHHGAFVRDHRRHAVHGAVVCLAHRCARNGSGVGAAWRSSRWPTGTIGATGVVALAGRQGPGARMWAVAQTQSRGRICAQQCAALREWLCAVGKAQWRQRTGAPRGARSYARRTDARRERTADGAVAGALGLADVLV